VLYEGMASTVCCASMPFYGYGMKMFPHATRRAGRFQLRLANMSALQMARCVPSVWRGGTVRGIHDFYIDSAHIEFEDEMPYQLGGEAMGYRREVTFSLASYPVTLLGQA
jgi:diacylglycerol kinase family enzyme